MYNNLLERVPRGLPRRAKTLMLLHNMISEIGRNDLAVLYTLTELNLSYNKLTNPRLHREAFRKLRVLETLDLSGNSLHSFPPGLPRSLQILKIKNNQLNSIPDGALTGMEKLQKLILSDNQLKLNSVYQGAWMELSALTVSRTGMDITKHYLILWYIRNFHQILVRLQSISYHCKRKGKRNQVKVGSVAGLS